MKPFKAMKTMMLPKWLRFKLNVTSYPHSTDVFFRNIISDIIENGKKTGKKNLISLMAENIIDDSEELTASKGMTKLSSFPLSEITRSIGGDSGAGPDLPVCGSGHDRNCPFLLSVRSVSQSRFARRNTRICCANRSVL
jgi:hypothetical protein